MKTLSVLAFSLLCVAGVAFGSASKPVKGKHPARIAQGSEVALAAHAVPGKLTIFGFTSDFCPPGRMIAPMLDALHEKRDDLAVVAIDINRPDVKGIDWKSPVARQYELRSIPHFKIFDAKGKMIAEGDAAREMVMGWLGE